jgi:peptide/nickel transport system permease protein
MSSTNRELNQPQPVPAAAADERVYVASQWQLMWWKFRRHKVAMVSGVIIILLYIVALIPEFLAPFDPNAHNARAIFAPPQPIRFVDASGTFHLRPFVYALTGERNPETLLIEFGEDTETMYPIQLFVPGVSYKFLSIIETDIHLCCITDTDGTRYLMGSDRNGRDMLSRIIYGTHVSMSIGLVGVELSLVFGILLGGLSGYYGGWVDDIIQRLIDYLRSIPSIPLWLAWSAALPTDWTPLQI